MQKYIREECANKRRMDMSRPCMLPDSTKKEILDMLVIERQVTSRLLMKIYEKVTRWYDDNGYEYACVVDIWGLDSRELVFEVVEGEITHVVIQFQDQLGHAVTFNHSPDEKNEGGVLIEILLKEMEQQPA
ncbi:hypothetical protein POM88_050487 [Heracleum sosnowskyi]|uniref:Toc75-like second POTRA domain-containing protein n=1 Tax=Heracleum sosnowskyi TaxID=360622 RepID=A0AAD8GYT8_9APIA|nr:hypothetical protein POM88_050487 [Heracleum sosnowskyi]